MRTRRFVAFGAVGVLLASCGKLAPVPHYDWDYDAALGDGAPIDLDALYPFDGGPPFAACVPQTCDQLGYECGQNSDGCNGILDCGTCPSPQFCGGAGYSKCGGIMAGSGGVCEPGTCASLGVQCGPAGDGCGGALASCGSCATPEVCGGGGRPSQCGGNAADAGACTNLCQQQVSCPSGTTTITGTVYAPTTAAYLPFGGLPDPLYNALVYVPNGPVQPFSPGVSCDVCGAPASGNPLVSDTTGPSGQFTLSNAPCGTNIPLVIQLGRWRRQITIPSVACCGNTALTPDQTRLPRNQSEGDIPAMAIVTGSADPIECVLPKIGIDPSEFTDPGGGGRIEIYIADSPGAGAAIDAQTPTGDTLWNDPNALAAHDLVVFDCEGQEYDKPMTALTNVLDYVNAGGRVFASHYSYVWLFQTSAFASTAAWYPDFSDPPDPLVADIDTTFQKGQDLASWLGGLSPSALSGQDQITVQAPRNDVTSVNVPPSQQFLYADPSMSSDNPLEFTFNTPVGATTQCGRVLFSDFHVNTGGSGSGTFPAECPVEPMTSQEKLLEFMLFDLTSCVQQTQPVSLCTPQSCASTPGSCGPVADGCGGLLQCGGCTAPQTCGGGGVPGVCGQPGVCTPTTCQALKFSCGSVGDGCGNLLGCGACAAPLSCGGNGTPGQCGGGIR